MKQKKILFISETYPSGLTGTSVKTRSTIEYLLAHDIAVDVACINFKTLVKKELVHPNLRIFSVYREGVRKIRLGLFLRLIQLVFSIKPVRVNRIFDERLLTVIRTLIGSTNYDFIFYDGFSTLQYVDEFAKNNVYIDDEDITILVKKRMDETANPIIKLFMFSEYLRCRSFEDQHLQKMGSIWGISHGSLKRLKTLSPAAPLLMPTPVDAQKNVFQPSSRDIVFTGTLSWSENFVGLRWFIKNCWNDILKELPDTRLFIVGQQGGDNWELFVKDYKNIELLGYVDDLVDVYKKCALAISPIFINVGIKVKVLTYLSYGLPVVATKLSLGGMSSQDGVVVAPESKFAQTVVKVLKNVRLRQMLSISAQKNIKEHHSEQALKKFFVKAGVLK